MKAENLYHTGIVVDDIEATMVWLQKVAGYTWTDVVTVDQEAVTPDGEVTIPMKMVYSGAEPRLELLQSVPGTVWTPADSGVHHIGYGVVDVTSALAKIADTGVRLVDERPRHGSMGASIAFLHPKDTGGVLTELVQAMPHA